MPRDGKVKSWTLTLAQPTNSQRSFFNGFFGTPPEARLAILRRVAGTNPPRYNLRRQGSIHVLSPYLGQTVKFGASLQVQKGDIVGLTVPTWAPAFAQGLTAKNVWRASREPGKCTNATDVRQGEPQQKVGTRATYGCKYSTARLLYTVTVVEELEAGVRRPSAAQTFRWSGRPAGRHHPKSTSRGEGNRPLPQKPAKVAA